VGNDTFYEILGVSPTASGDEIKAKYRKLIQRIHPDLDGPAALFRQVQEAYEVLSDPARRAAYNRSLAAREGAPRTSPGGAKASPSGDAKADQRPGGQSGSGQARPGARGTSNRSAPHVNERRAPTNPTARSFLSEHPARPLAICGAALLVIGAAMNDGGREVMLLGVVVLIAASVAGLGGRGAREREAYQRMGMAAVDAMTGRQFRVLLEHFFANKGYRVARLGVRDDLGVGLLLANSHERTIVQVRRWTGVVRQDAVQQAADAKAHYGAGRALVVTSSNYSEQAVTAANSNGVTLWNRSILEAELSAFRGQSGVKKLSSDLRTGSRTCLGFVATLFVVLVASSAKTRRRSAGKRTGG
jgi:DnaJ domain/Restriction endonuclease